MIPKTKKGKGMLAIGLLMLVVAAVSVFSPDVLFSGMGPGLGRMAAQISVAVVGGVVGLTLSKTAYNSKPDYAKLSLF
jgi:outer membrane lipoprotein SlyB